jgi:uncharacterized protein
VGGSMDSIYVVRASVALYRAGLHVVQMNMRGIGLGAEGATSLYHAGLTTDLDRVVRHFAGEAFRDRVSGLGVLGISMGGNQALKLAGEWGEDHPRRLLGVATISAPTDLVEVSRAIERRRAFVYRRFVLRNLVRHAQNFARMNPTQKHFDEAALPKLRSIRSYDETVIVPMHRFASARDYYQHASSGPYLGRIRVPTRMIHAKDDPMVPLRTVSPWLRGVSSEVEVVLTERGGHIGWFDGVAERHWVDTWAITQARRFFTRDERDDSERAVENDAVLESPEQIDLERDRVAV